MPVLWTVFSVSARLGRDSGKGLIELIHGRYGQRSAALMAVGMIAVNLAMIVADLRAVSYGLSLITNQSFRFYFVAVAFTVWFVLIGGSMERISRILGVIALAQLAYVAAAVLATSSWPALLKSIFLPHVEGTAAYCVAVIALFGSLLTPDVIVWQTSLRKDPTDPDGSHHSGQSQAGTLVATLVSLSAVIAASGLNVADPSRMDTVTAAKSLTYLGTLGPVLFSLGIVGSGMVALPVLIASMCFSIAEATGWVSGLGKNPWEAQPFYLLLTGTVFIAVVVNFARLNTVAILYWSQ
jgi:Mn2+/Fe2+ NRAMP family transporter